MNPPIHAAPEFPAVPAENAADAMVTPRPFYWSIRRELWENRSLYIAPLTIAGVALFANMIRMFRLPQKMRTLAALPPDQQQIALFTPFSMAAAVILFVGIIVGMFYCLDALHGE